MLAENIAHGDLRTAILREAARLVAERGADRVSLRELARDAGVSHPAPTHHFTDRRGLFTALAALEHPGHYQVMFNRSLVDASDAELAAAEAAAAAELSRGVATLRDPNARADQAGATLAAWSLVHGFSVLWLNDAVNARVKSVDP